MVAVSSDANAQTLRLAKPGTGADLVTAKVSDIVSLEIFADLRGVKSYGIALYIKVPEDFEIIDRGHPSQEGTQPFTAGPLFEGAVVATNLLLQKTSSQPPQWWGNSSNTASFTVPAPTARSLVSESWRPSTSSA